MSTIGQDTFTDPDGTNLTAHVMNVGPGWTALTGAWFVQTNKALVPDNTANALIVTDVGQSDVVISGDVTLPNQNFYSRGLSFRVVDASNFWAATIERDNGTPYLVVYEFTAGASPIRAQVDVPAATNTTPTITVTLSGTSITAAASTGESCNYTSAVRQTATKHGLYAYTDAAYAGATAIDNFLVTGAAVAIPDVPVITSVIPVDDTHVQVNWSQSGTHPDGWTLQYDATGNSFAAATTVDIPYNAGSPTFSLGGLMVDQSYDFRMRAYFTNDSTSHSDWSNTVTVTPGASTSTRRKRLILLRPRNRRRKGIRFF